MPFEDPYAPPRETGETRDVPRKRPRVDFIAQQRSLLPVGLLWLLTLGVYTYVWLVTRRAFLDSLRSRVRIGVAPWLVVGVGIVQVPISLAFPNSVVANGIQVGVVIAYYLLVFRIAGMLREHFEREEMRIDVSRIAVFFLGVFYLQFLFNAAAKHQLERRAARERRRRKKRRAGRQVGAKTA